MPRKQFHFRWRKTGKSAGATYDELKSARVEPGKIYVIQQCSFENETSDYTLLEVYIDVAGYRHLLWDELHPAGGKLYWQDEDLSLGEGEQLVIRFTGCTGGDVLAFYATGYWKPREGD